MAALLLAASSAQAATPAIDIHSAGPLSDIYIGNDLSCQVRSGGFSSTEFFPNASGPGDCGTFLFNTGSDSWQLRAPGAGLREPRWGHSHDGHSRQRRDPVHAGEPVVDRLGHRGRVRTALRPSSSLRPVKSEVFGRPPFTEVDTYVVGQQLLPDRRHGREQRARGAERHGELYHAADCQLRGERHRLRASSERTARRHRGRACACTLAPSNDQVRDEEFVPITITSGAELAADDNGTPTRWPALSARGSLRQCRT